MSLKNKALTEAHEKAQADQEAFDTREKLAAERRKEERINRQAMMGEREKNRMRKLQALGGREWDAEKNEDDFKDEGRRARRGAHGGITGSRHSMPMKGEAEGEMPEIGEGGQRSGYGSLRGGRGRGSRGGRGRGDYHQFISQKHDKAQTVPTAADFPNLPAATPLPKSDDRPSAPKDLEFPNKKKTTTVADGGTAPRKIDTTASTDGKKDDAESRPKLDKQTSFGFSPATEKRSWADQMDATSP
jgi:hypothetical protein